VRKAGLTTETGWQSMQRKKEKKKKDQKASIKRPPRLPLVGKKEEEKNKATPKGSHIIITLTRKTEKGKKKEGGLVSRGIYQQRLQRKKKKGKGANPLTDRRCPLLISELGKKKRGTRSYAAKKKKGEKRGGGISTQNGECGSHTLSINFRPQRRIRRKTQTGIGVFAICGFSTTGKEKRKEGKKIKGPLGPRQKGGHVDSILERNGKWGGRKRSSSCSAAHLTLQPSGPREKEREKKRRE